MPADVRYVLTSRFLETIHVAARRSNIPFLVAWLLGIAVLCALGSWQVKRLAWKEAMIARVEQGLDRTPVSVLEIEQAIGRGEDIEYHPAFAEGRFHHDREQHYFATHKSQPGYFIYTPLELADGRMLFVNRGHVSMNEKAALGRTDGQIEGMVRVEGLARSAPGAKPNTFVPDNDLAGNVYYWKSLSQMTGNAYDKTNVSTVGFFLDANDAPNPGGLPVGGVTLITFPNNHLQYAITWFGLAASLIGVGGYFFFVRAREEA